MSHRLEPQSHYAPYRPPCAPAPYACDWTNSRGFVYAQAWPARRSVYQRDRDRLIHARSFRRLKHKTQVFVSPKGDHFRTRLTHSLEVAQIARALASALGLDCDLSEAAALAHDLGHPPFGHAGEQALAVLMQPFGGFDHNVQTLRVVCLLERRYCGWPGLNLSWETLEAIAKHGGPIAQDRAVLDTLGFPDDFPDMPLSTRCSLEGQVAAIADDIAYNHHDLDDGMRVGLFSLDDVRQALPHIDRIVAVLERAQPRGLGNGREGTKIIVAETLRRLIGDVIEDVLHETLARLAKHRIASPDEARRFPDDLVAFSDDMAGNQRQLKAFLFARMYSHADVREECDRAIASVRDIFAKLCDDPTIMPDVWYRRYAAQHDAAKMRVIADYIAGMSDGFALRGIA